MPRRRPRPTAESVARAQRIADALSGLLEEEHQQHPDDGPTLGQDPYRARPTRSRPRPDDGLSCPGCGEPMILVYERGLAVERCGRCGGLWLDPGEIDQLTEVQPVARPDLNAIRTAVSSQLSPNRPNSVVRYRKCPHCRDVMNRINFGTLSGVIIDECRQHGVFLDADELEAIETFVRLGGQELAQRSRQERLRIQAERAEDRAHQAEMWAQRVGFDGRVSHTTAHWLWRAISSLF